MGLEYIDVNSCKVPFLFEENKALPIVSLKIVFKVSGKVEDGKKCGLSQFCAKILEEGTKDLGANRFAQKLEDRAIELNVVSGVETLSFSLSSLKESFKFGANMLFNLLENPNLTDKSIQKVKTLTSGKILGKKSDFDYLANLQLQKLLYKNSPLQNSSLGNLKSVKSIELEDVKNFLNSHLDLENAMVLMGGDIDFEEAKKVVCFVLGSLQKGKKREINFIETSQNKQIKITKKPSEQAYIYFGSPFDLKIGDKDAYKSKVMAFILGASGFGSRLMEEIRVKRGLAYSAYGRIDTQYTHSSFLGYLQTKNENKDEALKIVKQVVQEFTKNGVSEDELNQAKKFLLGSEPLRNETLNQRLSRAFVDIYSGYHEGYSIQELELINSLSLHDLNDFISVHEEIERLSFSIITNENS